jgi:hypothetical protein
VSVKKPSRAKGGRAVSSAGQTEPLPGPGYPSERSTVPPGAKGSASPERGESQGWDEQPECMLKSADDQPLGLDRTAVRDRHPERDVAPARVAVDERLEAARSRRKGVIPSPARSRTESRISSLCTLHLLCSRFSPSPYPSSAPPQA